MSGIIVEIGDQGDISALWLKPIMMPDLKREPQV